MEDEIMRAREERERLEREKGMVALASQGVMDAEIYSTADRSQFDTSIDVNDMIDEDDEEDIDTTATAFTATKTTSVDAPKAIIDEVRQSGEVEEDVFKEYRQPTIAERESDYQAQRRKRILSPERADQFGGSAPSSGSRTYADVMQEQQLEHEENRLREVIKKRESEADGEAAVSRDGDGDRDVSSAVGSSRRARKASRWDVAPEASAANANDVPLAPRKKSRFDDAGPSTTTTSSSLPRSRWDEADEDTDAQADSMKKKRSRWDETPDMLSASADVLAATPMGASAFGATPAAPVSVPMTPEAAQMMRWQHEVDERNRPLSDEELDQLFPPGYKILDPPASYVPIRTPSRKLLTTPAAMAPEGFHIQDEAHLPAGYGKDSVALEDGDLPFTKPEDYQHFGKLLEDVDESELPKPERTERMIMLLLLKIKNGTPPQRKQALRFITDSAKQFGAGPLFNIILPLLMSPSLEDQERHLLVKVIDRILYKLDDLVRPYVHKILVVIEPLLIDEDFYARCEGREIIANLSKAAGLATMIATMRPDIDNVDEYVRNTTARAFSVVASALGIPALIPFLRAVCKSKKSWQARHTGIKIVQQVAILMGCAVLPHLKQLVECIQHGLIDDQSKVRTITALALSALAEASHPFGIEAFDEVLKPLWKGIRDHRGKGLAAFLKAIGYIIPLMDSEFANYYTKEVMTILIREFASPDEEMKKIVLKVVKQCIATDGVTAEYVREEILPHFFKNFWVRRMALDRRNYRAVVETTVELANKVGVSEIVGRVVNDLKDDAEMYRKMVVETVDKIIGNLGVADIDSNLEERLMDGILSAFQEQTSEDNIVLNGFGTIVNALGLRATPYLEQLAGTIKWRMNNKVAKVRQQAADLIAQIAVVMRTCGKEQLLQHMGLVLYEYLGEEYPDVLGSIMGGLKAVVSVIGMSNMQPPIKDILPRLTPILKNRHEVVQENTIDLVGRIADRGAELVSPREWMRICFELLEMLKAHKKAIRRAAVNCFGYIARAIGPQDVLATLLQNLKVQDRQMRVCTTVAIAIVAETCAPFTVIPALMSEYRVPERNIQNGVLKAMSFLFEYIGELSKDYVYAVTPLLEDALEDRDPVHRQTACTAVKHIALGVRGLGCEDAMQHLLNFVWPNVFETSPHVINAVNDAISGIMVALGPTTIMQYLLQGLFHPARKVRDAYWKVYNGMYIWGQDALTPAYPRLENPDDEHRYERSEMFMVL